jgi:capsular polysaccharide transport system permease protein
MQAIGRFLMLPPHPKRLDEMARFLDALDTQRAVLGALIIRELQIRYGRDNLGFFWVFAEPMLLASVISTLHYFGTSSVPHTGIGPFPFTLVGYCLFIIFRNTFNRAESAIDSARALMHHRMVTPLDIMMSLIAIEFVGCLASLTFLMAIGIALGIADFPARPLYLFAGAFLISWFAFALSLVIAGYTYGGHLLTRLVHPISYFMMPLSGAFVTMSFLPGWVRNYMAWNPMMAIFEIARYGQFEAASPNYMYFGFVIATCIVITYWGMVLIKQLRAKIHVS